MNIAVLVTLLFAFVSDGLCVASGMHEVEILGTGAVVTVPDDWDAIPADVLQQYKDFVVARSTDQATTRKITDTYKAAYQKRSESYFSYPYVILQATQDGRIPEYMLKQEEAIARVATREVAGVDRLSGGLMTGVKLQRPVYDPNTRRLWMAATANVDGVGRVSSTMAIVATEVGKLQLNMYCLEADATKYQELFQTMGNGLRATPALAYSSHANDTPAGALVPRINWGAAAARGLATGLLFGVIAGIRCLLGGAFRGRRSD